MASISSIHAGLALSTAALGPDASSAEEGTVAAAEGPPTEVISRRLDDDDAAPNAEAKPERPIMDASADPRAPLDDAAAATAATSSAVTTCGWIGAALAEAETEAVSEADADADPALEAFPRAVGEGESSGGAAATTAPPTRGPKELIPTSALDLLSSAICRFLSLVVFLSSLISAATATVSPLALASSWRVSSSVSARMPRPFREIEEDELSEVDSIQCRAWRRDTLVLLVAIATVSTLSAFSTPSIRSLAWTSLTFSLRLTMSQSSLCVGPWPAHSPMSILSAIFVPSRRK
mmetsp:Transcript_62239/g.184073  ORF Transcript_62239/g.184073 Transcript_62239/m.184073 type:complete len:293 (-) Transcript_62239:1716-2594(-)